MSGRLQKHDQQPIAASDVERIVREVLARLTTGPLQSTNGSVPPTNAPLASPVPQRWLDIDERIVTVQTLTEKVGGKSEIRIGQGTIVTPAARDWLREKKVNVRYVDVAASPTKQPQRLILGVAESDYEPTSLIATLKRRSVAIEQIARVGLLGVIDGLAERVGLGGERAVLLTSEPEAAVCLANRSRGVRAVACGCAASTRTARARVGTNLLIVEPRGKSVHELSKMASELCASGSSCPEKYSQRLS